MVTLYVCLDGSQNKIYPQKMTAKTTFVVGAAYD